MVSSFQLKSQSLLSRSQVSIVMPVPFLYHPITDSNDTDDDKFLHKIEKKKFQCELSLVWPIGHHRGRGAYELHCSQPPDGDPDELASFFVSQCDRIYPKMSDHVFWGQEAGFKYNNVAICCSALLARKLSFCLFFGLKQNSSHIKHNMVN